MSNKLLFKDIEYRKIYAIDISEIIDLENMHKFNYLRNTRNWLYEIKKGLESQFYSTPYDVFFDNFKYPEIGLSDKIPVKKEYMECYSPLIISLPLNHKILDFAILEVIVKIHQEGSLTINFKVTSVQNKNWEIDDFVNDLEVLKKDINVLYINTLTTIVESFNKINIGFNLTVPMHLDLNSQNYEIILFDYAADDGDKISPKEMCREENIHLLRQLIGFTRLARNIAWENYSHDYCLNFYSKNIGSRNDEYWLIYKERFIRFFPNKNDKKSLFWLQDAISVIEILLAKKVMLSYIIDWTENELKSFNNIDIENGTINSSDLAKQVYTSIKRSYYLMSITHDPLIIRRYIKHDFFNTFFNVFNKELKIDLLVKESKEAISNLNQINSIMSNYLYSKTNLTFQDIMKEQVHSQEVFNKIITNENRKIEKRNLIIAFIGLLIGIAQIIDNTLITEILNHIKIIKVNTFSVFFSKILLIILIPSLFLVIYYIGRGAVRLGKHVWKRIKGYLKK